MTEETSQDFEGFILPDGEKISIENVDRMVSYVCGRVQNRDRMIGVLWDLSQECAEREQYGAASAYADKILAMVESPADQAFCFLRMGLIREKAGDLTAALEAYSRAFSLPQEKNFLWYFLNNNLAYCENHAGRHREAAKHCRVAIKINSRRHNAHKNLGIALQGLNRFPEAAKSYVRAAGLCPSDTRALELLAELLAAHPEVLDAVPDLLDRLDDRDPLLRAIKRRLRPQ